MIWIIEMEISKFHEATPASSLAVPHELLPKVAATMPAKSQINKQTAGAWKAVIKKWGMRRRLEASSTKHRWQGVRLLQVREQIKPAAISRLRPQEAVAKIGGKRPKNLNLT